MTISRESETRKRQLNIEDLALDPEGRSEPTSGARPTPLTNATILAERLRKEVNWDAFFTLLSVIGDSLNSPKHRFIKSDFLELAIDVYGPPALKWVDKEGWDHELDGKVRIEMKHHTAALYTRTGQPKPFVGQIRMKNTLGGGETRSLRETFHYLLITDNCAAALVPWDVVAQACTATNDAIVIGSKHLPASSVSYIVRPGDINTKNVPMPPIMDMLIPKFRTYIKNVEQAMK